MYQQNYGQNIDPALMQQIMAEMKRQQLAKQIQSMPTPQAIQANRPQLPDGPMQGPMPTDITPQGQVGPTPAQGSVAGAPMPQNGNNIAGGIAALAPMLSNIGSKPSSAKPIPNLSAIAGAPVGGAMTQGQSDPSVGGLVNNDNPMAMRRHRSWGNYNG